VLASDAAATDFGATLSTKRIIAVMGGPPCQMAAHNGAQRGLADVRAPLLTVAPFRAADLAGAWFVVLENGHRIATLHGGSLLRELDDNAKLAGADNGLGPFVRCARDDDQPLGAEIHDVVAHGGPLSRKRFDGHFERARASELLEPVPPLRFRDRGPARRIRDVTLGASEVPEAYFVSGRLVLRPRPFECRPDGTIVAADLYFGGRDVPVSVGSHVLLKGDDLSFRWIVVELCESASAAALGRALRLFDDRPGSNRFRWAGTSDVAQHNQQVFPVLSEDGSASAFTSVGVPPLGPAKQLWLTADGRARQPTPLEMHRLLELHDDVPERLEVLNPRNGPNFIAEAAGASIAVRLADAMAHRLAMRARQLAAALELKAHQELHADHRNDPAWLEVALAQRFRTFPAYTAGTVACVVIVQDGRGVYRALVAADLTRLPCVVAAGAGSVLRASAKAGGDALLKSLFPDDSPVSFLVHHLEDSSCWPARF